MAASVLKISFNVCMLCLNFQGYEKTRKEKQTLPALLHAFGTPRPIVASVEAVTSRLSSITEHSTDSAHQLQAPLRSVPVNRRSRLSALLTPMSLESSNLPDPRIYHYQHHIYLTQAREVESIPAKTLQPFLNLTVHQTSKNLPKTCPRTADKLPEGPAQTLWWLYQGKRYQGTVAGFSTTLPRRPG